MMDDFNFDSEQENEVIKELSTSSAFIFSLFKKKMQL